MQRLTLQPSNNRYDWLGNGIYFWEHGPNRALEWAEELKRRGKIKEPYVLGAFIHLGRCFDLTDTVATGELSKWFNELEQVFVSTKRPLPENKGAGPNDHDLLLRYLDCAVINLGLAALERDSPERRFQTVRGVFQEGPPAFPRSRIQARTHVQIAVRDSACILGYFLPAT